jgi:signal transduction histidine kinase
MTPVDAQLSRLGDILPESTLFVDQSGRVLFANGAAVELLLTNRTAISDTPLCQWVADPPEKVAEYLGACSRGNQFTIGLLTFRTSSGNTILCRCEGALLKLAQDPAGMLVLRVAPKAESISCFTELNEQIALLASVRHHLENKVNARTDELTAAHNALRQLSATLLRAQDDERRRVARDLHDSTGQLLTAIQLNLISLMGGSSIPAEGLSKLSEAVDLTNQAIAEIRTMSYLLHPPMLDEAGLSIAIRWYVDGFTERSNIDVTVDIAEELGRLSRELELAVFRIVQECLTNIHRHSGSTKAEISIALDDRRLLLTVRDNGHGLPPVSADGNGRARRSGVGIRGMRERVLQLDGSIEFLAGNPGTVVRVEFPLSSEHRLAAQSEAAAGKELSI